LAYDEFAHYLLICYFIRRLDEKKKNMIFDEEPWCVETGLENALPVRRNQFGTGLNFVARTVGPYFCISCIFVKYDLKCFLFCSMPAVVENVVGHELHQWKTHRCSEYGRLLSVVLRRSAVLCGSWLQLRRKIVLGARRPGRFISGQRLPAARHRSIAHQSHVHGPSHHSEHRSVSWVPGLFSDEGERGAPSGVFKGARCDAPFEQTLILWCRFLTIY